MNSVLLNVDEQKAEKLFKDIDDVKECINLFEMFIKKQVES